MVFYNNVIPSIFVISLCVQLVGLTLYFTSIFFVFHFEAIAKDISTVSLFIPQPWYTHHDQKPPNNGIKTINKYIYVSGGRICLTQNAYAEI